MFENDPSVMYFSVHMYQNAKFFPGKKAAGPKEVGKGKGAGYIPLT
jgi:acetoin utilization deacetylase AcuC-like enzyme